MKKFFITILLCFVVGAAHAVCADGEFDADGTCVESKFQLTTVDLNIEPDAEDITFLFSMSPFGTFYVDCGADGTLDGTGVSGKTIVRSSATLEQYSCTYTTGGVKTIQFGGLATSYGSSLVVSIQFGTDTNTPALVRGISGSLSSIFPTKTSGSIKQPRFSGLFSGCSNMTGSIPPGLFSGLYGTPQGTMFGGAFANCSGLTGSIPPGLFGNLSGQPSASMFNRTFYHCSGLTGSIPPGLFAGLSGSPGSSAFAETFSGCVGLTGSIPAGLFGGISGTPAQRMFADTFSGCIGLTGSIPAGLFGNFSGPGKASMFGGTFYGCVGLSGYIPKDIFENITSTGSAGVTNMFNNTNLYTACPCGTRPAATGWGDTTVGGKAICEIGLKSGEHWNNGICTTDCASGFSHLKTSTGLSYPVLSVATTEHSIHIQVPNNPICYVPLATGAANNNINVSLNGTVYHAIVPDETAPVGFTGQP